MGKERYRELNCERESEEGSDRVEWKSFLAMPPISIEICTIECNYLMKGGKYKTCA